MTPQEKAQELFDKMVDAMSDDVTIRFSDALEWHKTFKQCALIAVDEIIKALDDDIYIQGETDINSFINFWKEVKTEIEKL